ncbi:MAG: hypothetical protein Q8N89_15985 [Azonexus sp.]|nr:hypothetical protein [Azonexus sp.]
MERNMQMDWNVRMLRSTGKKGQKRNVSGPFDADVLAGGFGKDTLDGGAGQDFIFGDMSNDKGISRSFSEMLRSTGKNGQKRNVSGNSSNSAWRLAA